MTIAYYSKKYGEIATSGYELFPFEYFFSGSRVPAKAPSWSVASSFNLQIFNVDILNVVLLVLHVWFTHVYFLKNYIEIYVSKMLNFAYIFAQ